MDRNTKSASNIDVLRWRLEIFRKRIINFWNEFRMRKLAILGLVIIFVLAIVSVSPKLFTPYEPYEKAGMPWESPSFTHPLGTDDMGRDMLSQLIYGTRTSMIIGFSSAFLAFLIGTIIGVLSGFYGGVVDEILMRITEFFMTIPNFPLMVVLAFILKPSLNTVILAISISVWTQPVRVIRSEVLSLREKLYITRAKVIGNSGSRILSRYVMPKVLPLGFATMVIVMGWTIPSEAFLSWIGLGDPTNISWGMILYYAFNRGAITAAAWWQFIPPGLLILAIVTAFTIVGNAMVEVLNPKLKK
jgi:peptide/nickel transport system permease protein